MWKDVQATAIASIDRKDQSTVKPYLTVPGKPNRGSDGGKGIGMDANGSQGNTSSSATSIDAVNFAHTLW